MRICFRLSLFSLLCLFVINGNAQKSNTGNWFIYFGNQKINRHWNWHNEIQYRNYNLIGDLQQLVLRTGFGYNLSENNNNVLLGYAYVYSERYLPSSSDKVGATEHRIFQQFITKQNFRFINLTHRYRIEERFRPDKFQVRFRYFLSANIPITRQSMSANTLYLSMYNEIFMNATAPVFDRNRIYGAIGYVLPRNMRIEVGIMTQQLENSHRNQIQIVFFNNMNLHPIRFRKYSGD